MRGARPKDPGRRVGLPTENTRKRQQLSSGKHVHAQTFLDCSGNSHSLTQDDNWRVTEGLKNRNRDEANKGRPYYRGCVPTYYKPLNCHSGRGRSYYAETKPIVKPLSMNDLEEIHQIQSPSDVVRTLSIRADMFKALVNEHGMSDDVIEILLRIFVRVFEYKTCNKEVLEKRKAATNMLKDSKFFKSDLQLYTTQLVCRSHSNDKTESLNEEKIGLLSMFLRGFIPGLECEVKDLEMHITLLVTTSKALFTQHNLSKEALIEVERLKKEAQKCIVEAKEEKKKKRQHASAIREEIFDGPPPDDYRDIPILPTRNDLHTTEPPYLRPNITKGCYSDHHHYLDVQFRLLREDFVGPLRDGIQTHLADAANPHPRHQRKRNTDVRMYYDVQIEHPVFSEKGVHYRIQFSLRNLRHVKWKNTKRLIFGSLVCLSHNNFQTLLFGTVGNREEDLLCSGQVDLKLYNIECIENARVYTMVESTAFFESYRPVLQVLQQFNENSLPMENYIIRASHNIEQPKYLRNKKDLMYDITSLMKQEISTYDARRPNGLRNAHRIDVLDDNSWLKHNKFTLDESQLSAVKAALTKELAVIQGPPGTGKTYIGLKIVQILLDNRSHWSLKHDEHREHVDMDENPILVICYTNHALDQFLEGILSFSKKIVRIGGRSKSEKLESFNLKVLSRKQRNRPNYFQEMIDAISSQMIQAEELIKLSQKYIFSEYTLESFINANHFTCLQALREAYSVDGKRSVLPTWLGLLSTADEFERVEEFAVSDDEVEEEAQGDDSKTMNIITEFDMLLYHREYYDASDRKDYEARKEMVMDTLYTKLAYDSKMKCKDSPLKKHYATLLRQLSITDDEMNEREANRLVNIRRLSMNNRWRLYRYWLTQYKRTLREMLFNLQHDYDQLVGRRIHEENHEAKCEVIRKSEVVGMTTTGAAMNKELLDAVRPKIVIVEEAAEILEAHIVTSLTQDCEHLILIGDHQQLKPNPTVYKLATKYHLDTSLFERMLTNDVPCQRLSSQHRMRPEISRIMRKHFYSHLLDDESVNHFDNVIGVSHNVYFVNHDFKEEVEEDILSKSNVYEAEYCLALANYFFQQGYNASDISILTTYTGQVLNLKGKLKDKNYACLEGIYVSAVDNYQGEENEIILLSLVRSNEEGNIGFLKVSNRMCVALSRARKGLFCIGNFTLLAEKNDLWMKIVNDMRSSGRIGNHLQLHCHNHPETEVKAFIAKDFEQCPLGGCSRMCETRLDCGHVCASYCHPRDPHHEKYECREPCVRTCDRNHPCDSLCFQKCPPCKVILCGILLDCSHEANIQCAKYNQPIDCMEPCESILQCGHKCKLKCFESCTSQRCLEIVNKSFDSCGHDIQVECYIKSCQLPCEKLLTCGHNCLAKCGEMCTKECRKLIDKTFQCGHTVNVPCFTPSCVLPCSRERLCGHPCVKLCSESCGECLVKVRKELPCGHLKLLTCHENVEKATCKQMCTKTLPCEHPCKLLCYETCDAALCTKLVKKKLKCEHEKELPCNVIPGTIYKNKDMPFRYEFSTLPTQNELLNCNVQVIRTLKCGHEITIECYKSSHMDKIKCKIKVIETLDCGHDVTRECSKIGLCSEMCSRLLSCGHKCKEVCAKPCTKKCQKLIDKTFQCGHTVNVPCFTPSCILPCSRERPCGHPCVKLCGESCGYCLVKVRKELPCGHLKILFCHKNVESATCREMCTKTLPCGHPCMLKCYKTCDATLCTKLVKKKLKCDHEKELPCNVNLETLYKNEERNLCYKLLVSSSMFSRSKFSSEIELLNCNVEVTVTLECGHEITIECCESFKIKEMKCKQIITDTLDCGHDVTRECSQIGLCSKMCSRVLSCGHKCKEACANPCTNQCTEMVKKKLKCGHNKAVKCYIDVTKNVTEGEAACNFKTKVQLPCGHEEIQFCCQSYLPVVCSNRCSKKLLCGHFCTKECSNECSIDSCKQACNVTLACGHKCKGNCKRCSHGREHVACSQICRKKLICGHICQQTCSITPCQPCKAECNSWCLHRKCHRVCAEICEPCKLPCGWKCPHLKCSNACDEMCNRDRCNEPCRKTLRCKHKCLGLCGEPCLFSCLKCDPARYHPAREKGSTSKYVFLYDCSHAVEVSKMDAYMDKDEGSRQKECPKCHTTIINSTRYGNVLKSINVKITAMKRKICAERSMQRVQEIRKQIIDKMSVLKTIDPRKLLDEVNSRYGVPYDRLLVINIMIIILEKIELIRIDLNQRNDYIGSQPSDRHISQQLCIVENRVFNFTNSVSRQVLVDLSSELQRLYICNQLRNREHQLNSNFENSTRINNMLSLMLYTTIPVTHEISLDAFSLIEPASVEDFSNESLVDVVEKTVTGSSFCQDTLNTCAMGHVQARNRSEGNIQNSPECSVSKSGFLKITKVSEVMKQKNQVKGVKNLNQTHSLELNVENNPNQKKKSKNQRQRRQRQIKEEPKNENVNKSSSVSTDTRTSSQPQREGKDSFFNNMKGKRTRTNQEQQRSSAHSGTKSSNKNVSKITEDQQKEGSNEAFSSPSQRSKSTTQTSKPPAEGKCTQKRQQRSSAPSGIKTSNGNAGNQFEKSRDERTKGRNKGVSKKSQGSKSTCQARKASESESIRTKQQMQSSSVHSGTKASKQHFGNQPEKSRDEGIKKSNEAVSSNNQGSKSTNQTSETPAKPKQRNRGRGRSSSFQK